MADVLERLSKKDLDYVASGNMDKVSTEGLRLLAGQNQPQQNQSSSVLPGAFGLGAGASAVAGGAYWWNQPKREVAPIEQQFALWKQQNPNLMGVRNQDVPSLLGNQISTQSQRLKNIQNNVALASNNLKTRIKDIDNGILNSNVNELASVWKKGLPQFFNDTYNNYATGLDAIELHLGEQGINFDNQDAAKLLQNIRESAARSGVPETKLAHIDKMIDGLTPSSGGMVEEYPINFRDMKKLVDTTAGNGDRETQFFAASAFSIIEESTFGSTSVCKRATKSLYLFSKSFMLPIL